MSEMRVSTRDLKNKLKTQARPPKEKEKNDCFASPFAIQ